MKESVCEFCTRWKHYAKNAADKYNEVEAKLRETNNKNI